jgi:hypothetical protein
MMIDPMATLFESLKIIDLLKCFFQMSTLTFALRSNISDHTWFISEEDLPRASPFHQLSPGSGSSNLSGPAYILLNLSTASDVMVVSSAIEWLQLHKKQGSFLRLVRSGVFSSFSNHQACSLCWLPMLRSFRKSQ